MSKRRHSETTELNFISVNNIHCPVKVPQWPCVWQ